VSQGKLDLRSTRGSSRGNNRWPFGKRCCVTASLWLFLGLHPLFAQDVATHRWPVKILQRLLAPFRSNPFSQSSTSPCGPSSGGSSSGGSASATCRTSASAVSSHRESEPGSGAEDSAHPALLEVRADFRGPLAHHWLQLDSPDGDMTFGYGPATLPFIDSGEFSMRDRDGNIKWISGMHPLPWLALPPIKYHYARTPGQGLLIGQPIPLTAAQSEALTRKVLHVKFVGPYIPFFHDCRSFTCAMQASAQGHSIVPCYLLFKGYW
jgi:hypothetical protein